MTTEELIVTIVAGLAIVVGIVGTLLPIVPGLGLVWLAILAYGLLLGFGWPGWIALVLATILLVVGIVLGVRIPQRTATSTGLSVWGQLAGLTLAVLGFFFVPVVGAPLGFVLGVFLVRWQQSGDPGRARTSTKLIIGALLRASGAQALCGLGMGASWAGWVVAVALRPG